MSKLGLEERFYTQDGPQRISFIGWQLGEASSAPAGEQPPRWTDLSLFKTIGGQYILEKVGRSDVFHNETCEPKKGKRWVSLWDAIPAEAETDDPADIFVPCGSCNPAFDEEPVWVEKDIYSTATFSTAEELLQALYRPDTRNTSSKYLSRVARALLDQAIEKDTPLRDVLSAPVEVE